MNMRVYLAGIIKWPARRLQLAAGLAALASCAPAQECYEGNRFSTYTDYQVKMVGRTPKYDVSIGAGLDAGQVDEVLGRVAGCLQTIEASGGLTAEERVQNECLPVSIKAEVRGCLSVGIPPWYVSPWSGEQVFDCNVGSLRCEQKGQCQPNQSCSCKCRGIMQGDMILVTPNLKLLPATAVSMMTSCLAPWYGRLAECSR